MRLDLTFSNLGWVAKIIKKLLELKWQGYKDEFLQHAIEQLLVALPAISRDNLR